MILSSVCLVKAQTVISSCIAHDTVVKKYRTDSERLTIRRTFSINSPWKDSVKIDPVLKNLFLSALLAVYNATSLPARDSVVKWFHINTMIYPDLNGLFINADSNLIWMKNLRNNVIPTGNTDVDVLLSKYYLQKVSYWNWAGNQLEHMVTFKTDTNCNIDGLAGKFDALPGCSGGGQNWLAFDGNDITDSIAPAFTQLVYSFGWGDCQSGCIFKHYWKFRVYNDCSVQFIGNWGSSVKGFFVGLSEKNNSLEHLFVYPNPVKSTLFINYQNLFNKSTQLSIYNAIGQLVLETPFKNELDLSSLKAGIYYLRISGGRGNKFIKIIKE